MTTNVPGPQVAAVPRRPADARGASRTCRSAGHVRVGVAIYSYDGGLGFGVTGDYDTAPDIGVLCAGIEHGMGELLAMARATPPRARRRARRTERGAAG